ncbi:uncharacterized protein LOC142492016 [Ascaphus truei]|uniref:uncharacterized protein LOC142492016 n=1 Tax=Ascaphus truei TaxID=8439 RepID=UPI003F592846
MEKCLFHQSSTAFHGYIISDKGFTMDPEKLKSVLDWPLPNSLKAVQRFLGFSNYYRKFISNFSTIALPITALTKKGADPTAWSPEAIKPFKFLKRAFASAPILLHPDTSLPFTLEALHFAQQKMY